MILKHLLVNTDLKAPVFQLQINFLEVNSMTSGFGIAH